MGSGGDCEVDVAQEVRECRGGVLFAAWAVGGEVSSNLHPFGDTTGGGKVPKPQQSFLASCVYDLTIYKWEIFASFYRLVELSIARHV